MGGRRLAGACAVGAVVLSVLGTASHVLPLAVPLPLPFDSDVVVLHFFDGRSRAFWFRSLSGPIRAEGAGAQPIIWIHSQWDDTRLPEDQAGPPAPPGFSFSVQIGTRRQVPPLGGQWRVAMSRQARPPLRFLGPTWTVESSYLRLPTWPIAIALMVPPLRRSYFERRAQRRAARNECLACGYSLFGLIEPRCPECGSTFAPLRTG